MRYRNRASRQWYQHLKKHRTQANLAIRHRQVELPELKRTRSRLITPRGLRVVPIQAGTKLSLPRNASPRPRLTNRYERGLIQWFSVVECQLPVSSLIFQSFR